jgi:hypothetical protein
MSFITPYNNWGRKEVYDRQYNHIMHQLQEQRERDGQQRKDFRQRV